MIHNLIKDKENIYVFGNGAIYKQLSPLLKSQNIIINDVFDDKENPLNMSNIPLLYLVGYANMKQRRMRYDELVSLGHKMMTFIAKNTIISEFTEIGHGVIIHQGVILDNFVNIANCVLINIGVSISHDCIIKDNVYLSPQVAVSGFVTIESDVFIGTNATIIDNITIGKGAIIAAGAVVTKDVAPYTMVAGCPAVLKKNMDKE